MKEFEYIPKEFENVKLDFNTDPNPCTPGYTDRSEMLLLNKMLINVPRKILVHLFPGEKIANVRVVIPVCLNGCISYRRFYKYFDKKPTLHIRRQGEDEWFSGILDNTRVDDVFPVPHDSKRKQDELEAIETCQKYPDDELNTGTVVFSILNVNLSDFISIPMVTGVYDIFYTGFNIQSATDGVQIDFKWDRKP